MAVTCPGDTEGQVPRDGEPKPSPLHEADKTQPVPPTFRGTVPQRWTGAALQWQKEAGEMNSETRFYLAQYMQVVHPKV